MSAATSELETMDPRLLTELQKQDAVLAELPEDCEFRCSTAGKPSNCSGRAATRTRRGHAPTGG